MVIAVGSQLGPWMDGGRTSQLLWLDSLVWWGRPVQCLWAWDYDFMAKVQVDVLTALVSLDPLGFEL
jgi:hypothetical protein